MSLEDAVLTVADVLFLGWLAFGFYRWLVRTRAPADSQSEAHRVFIVLGTGCLMPLIGVFAAVVALLWLMHTFPGPGGAGRADDSDVADVPPNAR